jgi:hypothetical protein
MVTPVTIGFASNEQGELGLPVKAWLFNNVLHKYLAQPVNPRETGPN